MLGHGLLDWAIRSLSFFNLVALLWLGLTVLLNAEHRRWGTWVAGSGLVAGGLLFAAHSVLIERSVMAVGSEMAFWWQFSWLPFIGAPYLWYLVMVWYTGSQRAGRHRLGLALMSVWGLVAAGLLALTDTVPNYWSVVRNVQGSVLAVSGVPLAVLVYPVYSVGGILLALAALRRPAASDRFMGDLARRRARPWLVATSLVLLAISLVAGGAAAWLLWRAQMRWQVLTDEAVSLLALVDLAILALVAGATVLLGRAVVSYELFTGKTLPRRGLLREWQSSLLLAGGFGAVVGGSLSLPVDPLVRLLLATVLMTLFAALLSWRAYVERERGIDRLRPFVASQHLYEQVLAAPGEGGSGGTAEPFRALCEDVLGARLACLTALGPLAPLVGSPLVYPAGAAILPLNLAGLTAKLGSPLTLCVPLAPGQFGGAVWAVPLWSERGLIGAFLLGEKRDGGLYAQEEIEIARATGARLIDTQASAELAQRLMTLQRQRLAESQLLDRQARQTLHDDVLPRLHTAMLALAAAPDGGPAAEVVTVLGEIHRDIASLLRALPSATAPDLVRLGPLGALRQVVAGELAGAFEAVTWAIAPPAETAALALPPLLAQVVYGAAREAVRNAARHGPGETGRSPRLAISAVHDAGLVVTVEDDGVGLTATGARTAGSGQGLALHSTMMAIIGGTLVAEGRPGSGARITLALPPEAAGPAPDPPGA